MTYGSDDYSFSDDELSSHLLFSNDERNPWDIPTDDDEDDESGNGDDSITPIIFAAGDVPAGSVGRISYDRGTNEVIAGPVEVGRSDGPGPRATGVTATERAAAERVRARTAVDTGIGNVRGVAGQHSGSDNSGLAGGAKPAASIVQAADRLRSNIVARRANSPLLNDPKSLTPEPSDDSRGVDDRVKRFIAAQASGNRTPEIKNLVKLETRARRSAEFQSSTFECMVQKVTSTTAGDWLVTVKIPYEFRTAATELGSAYGLAIETTMTRKGSEDNDE